MSTSAILNDFKIIQITGAESLERIEFDKLTTQPFLRLILPAVLYKSSSDRLTLCLEFFHVSWKEAVMSDHRLSPRLNFKLSRRQDQTA